MRIVVDAWELGARPTGVGRYLQALLREWQHLPAARPHTFLLLGPPGWRPPEAAEGGAGPRFEARAIGHPGCGRTRWEQWDLPRALRYETPAVLFAPSYSAPLLCRIPVVLTVHDVSFAAHPEWFRLRERLRRRWLTRLSAQRAHTVVTDSRHAAGEIARHLGVEPSRLAVVPLGAPFLDSRPGDRAGHASAPVPPGHGAAPRDPLVLYVGSVFNRRRVPDLIRAFSLAASARPAARLAIVGENRTHPRENLAQVVEACGIAGRVTFDAWLSDEELAGLYRRATVFVFLSEYEGFGLTPLEALQHGVPIVVLDTPVAREVYGDGAFYVARGDVNGTAVAIGRVLDDPRFRAELLDRGHRVLARYSWTSAAERTLEIVLKAGRAGGPASGTAA